MLPLQPMESARRMLSTLDDDECIDLLTWSDGSYGISKNGELIGVWAPADEGECIKAFYRLGKFEYARHCVVVSRATVLHMKTALAEQAKLN